MSALPKESAATPLAAPTVDERNPWLGLASFTEETREYFYGREDEVAELARRVQRKLLTVLFGQSGLGKTSILRAGLVPRLRAQGYCPIYVRIDYAREAPEPAVQIKQAILKTARRSGQWTQSGVAVEGETLWEFLHHRDDVLRDEAGKTLIPLLIFDQFEEIFTLAQSDDFGRARAARFIADLADLVENRPPKEVEARLEHDDSAAERFDFARSDYRVLISLREDYLAPLEGLKGAMPSITQNRLRLAPMTGQQALAAVVRPGKRLVSEEVAAAIVRFVAGGAELANAEVEPSLLSLICRELNDTRLAQDRSEISLDLLAGSHATILSNFYERSLADQPAAVRRVIEDELLTESGFRENVAEERLLGSFAAAGAAPDALAVLVNRRLLRIEERLDVRRVELTHDVLCGVVKASRDLRKEREARDATERLLAAQREREQGAHRALVRARQVAAGCIVLAAIAIAAAVFGYVSTERARRAEKGADQARNAAEETRILAEQARGQAEQLLGYLSDDFSRELESFGRLDVVGELAKRQVDYFKALPAELKGPETSLNGALAMVHYGRALRGLGNVDAAGPVADEAVKILEQLRQSGDKSEATIIALAQGLLVQMNVYDSRQDPRALPTIERSAALLQPVAEAPKASLTARRAYVELLDRLGYRQLRSSQLREAVATLDKCKRLANGAGAQDLSSPDMAAEYATCSAWQTEAYTQLGQSEDGLRVGRDGAALAERVVKLRPNYLLALRANNLVNSDIADLLGDQMRNREALVYARRGAESSRQLLQLDPKNAIVANNASVDYGRLGTSEWSSGHLKEGLATYRTGIALFEPARHAGTTFTIGSIFNAAYMAIDYAEIGEWDLAREQFAEADRDLDWIRKSEPATSPRLVFAQCLRNFGVGHATLRHGDPATASQLAHACLSGLATLKVSAPEEVTLRYRSTFFHSELLGEAEYARGDFAAAERALREAVAAHARLPFRALNDRRDEAEVSTYLAMSLARLGKAAEAQQAIAPTLTFARELGARNHEDEWQHLELAAALYAAALTDSSSREAKLNEASALIAALPASMQETASARLWRTRIREALGKTVAGGASAAPGGS